MFLCITETWMSDYNRAIQSEFLDMGSKLYHQPKSERRKGGVGIIAKVGLDIRSVKIVDYSTFELYQVIFQLARKEFCLLCIELVS